MDITQLKTRPHWSYSAFSTFLTCPMKYYFRYIAEAEEEFTPVCLPFGRAFHAVLSEKAMKGDSFSLADAQENFALFFRGECDASSILVYKGEENFDTSLKKGFAMLEVAMESWQDDYGVKSVAESFSVEVPGLEKPVIGEFDLVVTDGGDTAICDWKTSASKWPAGKADRDLQATVFCYAFQKIYGELPLFRFDVYTKSKQPTLSSYYTVRTEEDLERFEFLAFQIQNAVAKGAFFQNVNSLSCPECPYRMQCRKEHKKGRS